MNSPAPLLDERLLPPRLRPVPVLSANWETYFTVAGLTGLFVWVLYLIGA